MAWSIFSDGGGQGVAVSWAQDLQQQLGIPVNAADTQFIYDWEVSEGGGGKFNPLNQGPVPGHPELTSTGQQYGGGAADFTSWQTGIEGASDYIHMPAYAGVLQGLQNQDYQQAEQALWNSPWAGSHYGYGSAWSNATPPGATPLPRGAFTASSNSSGTPSSGSNPLSVWNLLGIPSPVDALERLGLILLGAALILLGIYLLAGKQTLQFTPLGKFTQAGQQRTARRERSERATATGARQERALGLRERRVTLAERTEARHRGTS